MQTKQRLFAAIISSQKQGNTSLGHESPLDLIASMPTDQGSDRTFCEAAMCSARNPFYGDLSMLVISRKENQSIAFPGLGITIEVVRTSGNLTGLGISAPAAVKIVRGELLGPDEIDVLKAARFLDGTSAAGA